MAAARREGFDEFYGFVFGRLVGQLVLITGDLHEAEDLAQEALTRAAVHWPQLRQYDLPEAWVRRVALNLAANRGRQARRRLRALARLGPQAESAPPVSESAVALIQAMRRLPVHHRQAVVLHYLLDMPTDEAARTLGVPRGTVKSWLARGRKALLAELGDRQEEVPTTNG